jgi:aminoglycoside phosphotransferase (APT) family kinase protein
MLGLVRDIIGVSANFDQICAQPLSGGVSSDIYRVDVGGRTLCVKRALPKLKVAADWHVPVGRNAHEAAWLKIAATVVPEAVPALLATDPGEQAFAMEWLEPTRYPVWKSQLRDGVLDVATAAAVGDVIGRIHSATAGNADVSTGFDTDALFHAIRLEPYLMAAGLVNPEVADRMTALAERTARTRLALVHGDFSPKNLLIGPVGPVIVDAECAWYGDPAFDLAFVLNHLLLKGAWQPQWRSGYLELFATLVDAYRERVDWEPWRQLEQRAATLLPALLLARIDGKSPVEYLSEATARAVRDFARREIFGGAETLREIALRWEAE